MRLLAVLFALALALPAQAQERFFQSCVASAAGSEMPEGMDPGTICGCAAQQAVRAGVAPAALDELADHVPAGETSLDVDSLPDHLRPAAAATLQSMVGCALQLGMAEMMEQAAGTAAAGIAEALSAAPEAMAYAAPSLAAPAPAAQPMRNGVPPQLAALAASEQAQGAAAVALAGLAGPTTVSPDGTVASAPTARTQPVEIPGIRTGSGRPHVQAVQASKGAAIRILQ